MTSIKNIIPILTISSLIIFGVFTDAMGQQSIRRGDKLLCKNGNQQRSVQVEYYTEDESVPCEVHYYKDTEQPDMGQVLWRAANEAGFCEKKMAVVVDELSGSGWECQQKANTSTDEGQKDSQSENLPPDLSAR